MSNISQNTIKLVDILFSKEKNSEVIECLEEYCQFLRSYEMKENLDRLCFAILKLSIIRGKGHINKFHKAIELGKTDYRDLLVSAGFGNDVNIHKKWFSNIIQRET